ncbi:hypothetical protein ABB37_07853 [Leptomonas pyrrhocoris]|uniref:Uncharacterized protein n=1 Tax=Leptomonas pyrrhocoris TaxID=157538 RepID=A0A0M9FV31_LEPPY|nr:hypothetical protein ABB37_07853 [Leptomonas pyrrhocoris]KPA76569.1 hypothetical protein ABB37_07853 [Leptomonas pyrrhocoris]|eukprot:XP_015655008.1 hypothetical protein ABB37_07853 [Leptomonas pyrrhocoris]
MASTSFNSFSREWGGLLVQDSAASLDRLFDAYQLASALDARPATIEDYTDLWAAAKRANMEWGAACMVRSVRRSVSLEGAVTSFHLMTAMTCWAAALHQRTADFFKECKAQVRDVVARVVARCTAWMGEEGATVVYEEIVFCVALELFGWHDSLLTCLRAATAAQRGPTDEQDVLLFTATVAQHLTPKRAPRGFSTESTPSLTTGRISVVSSASEHDGMHSHRGATTTNSKEEVAVVMGCPTSPSQRCAISEEASSVRVKFQRTRAVGAARGDRGDGGGAAAVPGGVPSPMHPPTHSPPLSPLHSRAHNVPSDPPRSRGTPQSSPQNPTTPTHEATTPTAAPPRRRDSATTTTPLQEKSRSDEIRERRWPIDPKRAKATPKKDNQGCTAF